MSTDTLTIIGQAIRPALEGLEGRQLLSTVSFASHTLSLSGTSRADEIDVSLSKDGSELWATINGRRSASYNTQMVYAINIDAGRGDNRVRLDRRVLATTTVTTGSGSDTILTGAGNDRVDSGGGRDVIDTAAGNDTVHAATGNDKINAGSGNDLVAAGSGHDSVSADGGKDQLFGSKGNDKIYGDRDDTLDGGSGLNALNRSTAIAIRRDRVALPSVTRLSLVDADTGKPVAGYETLFDGATLDFNKLPSRVSVVASVTASAKSALFHLSDNSIVRIHSGSTLALTPEQSGGKLAAWTPRSGQQTLTVTPFTGAQGKGFVGDARAYSFNIVAASVVNPTPNPEPIPQDHEADPIVNPTVDTLAPQIKLTALKGSVVAGQAYHVEASKTVIPGYQAEDAKFEWDFGDAGSAFNKMPGFNAAHVYENPGNYTVKLTVTAPGGRVSVATTSVSVAATSYRTVYVSTSGNDNNDGLSQGSPVRSIARGVQLAGNDAKVLLKRGDTFMLNGAVTIEGRNVVVSSYGQGAKPVVSWAGARDRSMMLFIGKSAQDVTIRGLTLTSIYTGDTEQAGMPFAILNGGRATTIRDNTFLDVGYAINNNLGPTGVLVMNNDAPSETGIRDYFCWTQGTDLVIVGNNVVNSTREHVVRVGGADRLVIAFNDFSNLDRRATGDIKDFSKGAITNQKGSFSYIANNDLHGPAAVGPLGEADGLNEKGARFRHAVFEGNALYQHSFFVNHGAENITVRDNTIFKDNGTAIDVRPYDTTYGRGVVDLTIDHNVAVNNGVNGNFAWFQGGTDGVTLTNNVYVAPYLVPGSFGTAAVFINETDLTSFRRIDGNVWPSNKRASSYVQGGIVFLGKDYSPSSHLDPTRWNSMWQVGTDFFTDVSLDNVIGLTRSMLGR